MAGRKKFSNEDKLFYITFTCYNWYPLFQLVDGYDIVYEWFSRLNARYGIQVASYVIMPNHLHCIFNFPDKGVFLNDIIKQGKIFIAKELLKRLHTAQRFDVLQNLSTPVSPSRKNKGQHFYVFARSFDAKPIATKHFLKQKVNYIHLNPVRGNYNLVDNWRDYPYSSAGFYEYGLPGHFEPVHFHELA